MLIRFSKPAATFQLTASGSGRVPVEQSQQEYYATQVTGGFPGNAVRHWPGTLGYEQSSGRD